MKHVIITGASRGIGEGISLAFAQQDVVLYPIARKSLKTLCSNLKNSILRAEPFKADLSIPSQLEKVSKEIFNLISIAYKKKKKSNDIDNFSIYLINNAGSLAPVGPLGKLDNKKISYHFQLNLLAPLFLSNLFIKNFQDIPIKRKRILNISSGAATSIYYGWSCYGPAKAAVEHFTKIAALEQISKPHPIEIGAIAPGVVETRMQEMIRDIPEEDFPAKKRFVELHKQHRVLKPQGVGLKIASWLTGDNFGSGEITRIEKIK